ncbi:TonB-dependent receptor plug domain-containing protein [Gaetbulibacter aestuarii]|uniref:TonB-dependent receptor n=1 Tax=Gaetbulibacter aestuarii TaxID=1502358 RepID=A0ABW7MXH8_9FLAO
MTKKTPTLGVILLGLSLSGFAQQTDSTKVQQLDEVVITDSRFELKRENSGKTVIKITSEDIQRNQGRTISELINTKGGIEINGSRSVAGQNLGYFVRGGNNRQVLILIDGIQVNDPSLVSNDFDLRLLDLNTIESIEIIKGAASTLYGNAAATAVINITTKKADSEPVSGHFLTVIGTNQSQDQQNNDIHSFKNNAAVSGTLDKFSYLASFGNRYEDGLSAAKGLNAEKDPFSRFNTNLKLGYVFSEAFSLTAFGSYGKFKTNFDGYPPPNYTLADTNDKYNSEQGRVALAPKFDYKNGSLQVNAAFTRIHRETISAFPTINDAQSLQVDLFNKYVFDEKFYTIIGVDHGDYRAEYNQEESYTTTDPYVNVVYVSDFGLNLNAGTRLNNHSAYGSHLVYSINPSYKLSVNNGYAKIFGSYATSFIAPNLSQLYGYFGPNPDLQPEENTTIETGLAYNSNKGFKVSGLFFNRNEKNTIIYTNQYENAGSEATVQGVEIEVSYEGLENFSFNGNYAFTEVKDAARLRVPKQKINAGVGYDFSKNTFASVNYQYVGKRQDLDFSSYQNVNLKPFSLFDMYFSHRFLNQKLKAFISVTNILNEDYAEILGFTSRGRNINLGLNINL